MGIMESLERRRTVYALGRELPVDEREVVDAITRAVELVPDAFNMRSQRVVVAFGEKHDALWDAVFDAFRGKVAREKTDMFKAAAGTVLYFYDRSVVEDMQQRYPGYAGNFPLWAQQANGMLQLAVWTALRELDMGANLQHYNPVIDEAVRELFDLPEAYSLVAEMPFGNIVAAPDPKQGENVLERVTVAR